MHTISLRTATEADATAISSLITPFCPLAPGTVLGDAFLLTLSADAFRIRLREPAWHFIVAFDAGHIIGTASIKATQLTHLFVDTRYHGQGLARTLWQAVLAHARAQGNAGAITVNADVGAVEVYRRLGFEVAGEQRAPHGVAYIPMVFGAPSNNGAPTNASSAI